MSGVVPWLNPYRLSGSYRSMPHIDRILVLSLRHQREPGCMNCFRDTT